MRNCRAGIFTGLFVVATPCMAESGALERDLVGSAWLAEDIGGRGVVGHARTTLEFLGAGRVGGLAACNRFSGPVSFDGDGVAFGNLASTRKMCPEAVMDQEQRFFAALANAERIELARGGRILVAYGGGAPILRLRRVVEK